MGKGCALGDLVRMKVEIEVRIVHLFRVLVLTLRCLKFFSLRRRHLPGVMLGEFTMRIWSEMTR